MHPETRIFQQREREERALAETSASPIIRRVHERMADRYQQLLKSLDDIPDYPTR
jgi:hypothetical protein